MRRSAALVESASGLQPGEPPICLGIAYAGQGEHQGAKDAYQRAHDLAPSNEEFAKALTAAE
jgi:cytochrome c-type biogenesis protein CcmH/NrfG